LRVAGEHLWAIGPLDAESTAVELFVERAASVKRGFVLRGDERDIVVAVCRRLDGMPLAIELAASRMRSMTVEELAARLDQRFRLLTTGRDDENEPRHATLRAVVAWSYDLLEAVEQRLLCRLSVFPGSFDLEAVHAVCVIGTGDPDLDEDDDLRTLAVLEALVDRSLLVAEEHNGRTRFRLLETIRQWAVSRVGEVGAALAVAHAVYYVELLRRFRVAERVADDRRLPLETDNIRAAVYYALDERNIPLLLSIIRRLWRHVSVSMNLLEAEEWAKTALALPGVDDHPDVRWAHILCAAVGNITANPQMTVREAQAAIAAEERLVLEPDTVPLWWLCIGEIWLGNFDAAEGAAWRAYEAARPDQLSMRLEILSQLVHIAVYRGGEPDDPLLSLWRPLAALASSPLEKFTTSYAEGVIAVPVETLRAAEHFEAAIRHLEVGSLDHVLGGAAHIYSRLMRAGDDPRAALAGLEFGLAYYRNVRVAFGLRRLLRDFVPALCELGDHVAVAMIDGAAAMPVLRPVLVADAIGRSRAVLKDDQYELAVRRGRSMSDEELEQLVLTRLAAHLATRTS
jgi:hypothetical protein